MSIEETRFVGREEKIVLLAAVGHFGGVFSALSKHALTGDPEVVLFLVDLLDQALEARVGVEEKEARRLEHAAREQGIPCERWRLFKAAEGARGDLREYRTRLEAARKADAEWRAANPPKESAAG